MGRDGQHPPPPFFFFSAARKTQLIVGCGEGSRPKRCPAIIGSLDLADGSDNEKVAVKDVDSSQFGVAFRRVGMERHAWPRSTSMSPKQRMMGERVARPCLWFSGLCFCHAP